MEEEASMKNLIKGRELQEIIDDFEHDFRLIAWDKNGRRLFTEYVFSPEVAIIHLDISREKGIPIDKWILVKEEVVRSGQSTSQGEDGD